MRVRRLPTLTALVALALVFYISLRKNLVPAIERSPPPKSETKPQEQYRPKPKVVASGPAKPEPVPITNTREHPIELLVKDEERHMQSMVDRQSSTLSEAVAAYRARYGMNPPPHFDRWFEFAKKNKVQIIDDYDTIYHSLLPFWGLKPSTVRARVREAIGYDGNNLIAIIVRKGKVAYSQSGPEWQRNATISMMDKFVQWLPDMDMAFNIFDEPRVVIPSDELDRLVQVGKQRQADSVANHAAKNAWSKVPIDMKSRRNVGDVKITRFSEYPHQPTWISSRLSCPVDSPARALEEEYGPDNVTPYSLGPLGFIYNHTAFTDICNTPSLASSHGFFERPNAYIVTHDLIPVFSQSKMSSYQDILYPSPWYWANRVTYDAAADQSWTSKISKLWWVGSTTGGFSRLGGWRRQHRQQVVQKINSLDSAKILVNRAKILKTDKPGEGENPNWAVQTVERKDYTELMDVHFSHVGQCDPDDCAAQNEYFRIVEPADFKTAYGYKFLLDMDGNAFSGRFYAFLKSKSLPIKMAIFREWHEEWIRPWAHYIPISLKGDDVLESIRYLASDEEGRRTAERVAEQGRMWSEKVLRHEDYEAWFFRLLLEYARVIDDERDSIGYQS